VSVASVAVFFLYVNLSKGQDWIPLGYDSYYYVEYITKVISSGPLQFAASQHYVEFLYPILASIPVYLGASPNAVEVVLPALLACGTVAATAVLSLESRDWRISTLAVSFASGWFAIYRMGADFDANLLSFPLLILATVLLIRLGRKTEVSWSYSPAFAILVLLAAATHVESTDFFILVWAVSFVIFRAQSAFGSSRSCAIMILIGAVLATPFTIAYAQAISGGLGGEYCVFPPYWLEVFGPLAGLAILGFIVLARQSLTVNAGEYFTSLVVTWSSVAVCIGVLGYLTQFPIAVSDRALLLFPLPIVTSIGAVWIIDHADRIHPFSQTKLFTVLAIAIPLATVPLIFVYAAPHFRYFEQHGPSMVTCATS
jgi:hypothetical protein